MRPLLISTLLVLLLTACGDRTAPPDDGPLPSDAAQWVCRDSLAGATPGEIAAWCAAHPDRGRPLPASLLSPPPLSDLAAKNAYDLELAAFVKSEAYKRELGWFGDALWRFTGPYVGTIGSGSDYGTHLPVRVYYSPEVIDWLCDGRRGELPDGAMIVKEMHLVDEQLGVVEESDGCMTITADVEPQAWVPMLKHRGESYDGWYWTAFARKAFPLYPEEIVDPPLLDRSGATLAFVDGAIAPLAPDPAWYPTGYYAANPSKIPNVVVPQLAYGAICLACHASAESEHSFASLSNVLGKSIRYKLFRASDDTTASDPRGGHLPPFSEGPSRDGSTGYDTPFAVALAAPSAEFLRFFDQLETVSFADVWPDRLPAQTYDHVGSPAGGPDGFSTSDQCMICHDAITYLDSTANMLLSFQVGDTTKQANLSPYAEWQVSPMGLAGRDPIFYAQLEGETHELPELAACIENTCMHCHGAMGQRQLAADTPGEVDPRCAPMAAVPPPPEVPIGRPFRLEMVQQWPGAPSSQDQKYAALARDGVSCTVCHRVTAQGLGEESSFTGNFVTGPPDEIYGPYEKVATAPMKNALGLTPQLGEQIASSDLCGSCHNVLLPVFGDAGDGGRPIGYRYEQATHLEWLNSDYAPGRPLEQSCQGCHMPTTFGGAPVVTEIANFESSQFPPTTSRLPDDEITATVRERFSRHSLHGLNLFLNQMFQQFPLLLGFRQASRFPANPLQDPGLLFGERSMLDMALTRTASLELRDVRWADDGRLRATVHVANLTGHDLPSGVGFRRMLVELVVEDAAGTPLWASGRTNALGALLDGISDAVLPIEQPLLFPTAFQPHHQVIEEQDQVQIYQEVAADTRGRVTSSLLRRASILKDNRIRPRGYDPRFYEQFASPYIQALAETPGNAKLDPSYVDPALTGSDELDYVVTLDGDAASRAARVRVALHYQSIPPPYLQQRFATAVPAGKNAEIERLYYVTSHLDVGASVDSTGAPVLREWKVRIAEQHAPVPPRS